MPYRGLTLESSRLLTQVRKSPKITFNPGMKSKFAMVLSPGKGRAPEFLVVLCATCHRRMHYADVGEPIHEGDKWRVRIDEKE